MKLGYPCINRQLACTFSTFRLKNYSEEKLIETIQKNLINLQNILSFNITHDLYFFRISSDLIPFASHAICKYPWQTAFARTLAEIGRFIKKHHIRISMHPSQFVIINATDPDILQNSIAELKYHATLLNAMELDNTAKIQIHVGGVYGDKAQAMMRFITHYQQLPVDIKNRLVIENDDRLFSLQDCLFIHRRIGIPIIFDNLHHECLNNQEPLAEAFSLAENTWREEDGVLMLDYSSQAVNAPKGKHTDSLDTVHFKQFLQAIPHHNCDVMLEVKDKEASALQAMALFKDLRPI